MQTEDLKARQTEDSRPERRRALGALAALTGVAWVACGSSQKGAESPKKQGGDHDEAEVTPGEDLMQEHGLLERVLLVYDEAARRIDASEPLDVTIVGRGAGVVRRFVEEYHEQQEEQFVFPRLERAGRETELVAVLLRQHQRGRQVTEEIQRRTAGPGDAELARLLRAFVRMYRPHAAREDTVLFPAFREVVGASGYVELGEQFEDNEHRRFGEHGFEDMVKEVAALETALGIHELDRFTP